MRKIMIVLTQDEADPDVFNVVVPALPGCHTFGVGREMALASAKEAIELYLSTEADGIGKFVIHASEVTEIEVDD